MGKKLLLAGAALLTFASPTHARSMSYICEGTISHYPLMAYTAITGKDNEDVCIFVTNSPEGRKIFQTCPKGSQCSVEAEVNLSKEYEIYKVISVHRTGTRALHAKAKKDKEAEDQRRLAAIRPYTQRTANCVNTNAKGKVTRQVALDKFCSRERDALAAEFIKQYGPGGRYRYMDLLNGLTEENED